MNNKPDKIRKRILRFFSYSILILMALAFAFPFYYAFVLATWDVPFANPPRLFFGPFLRQNFNTLINQISIFKSILNSSAIAVLQTVTVIFFCTLSGFTFAKYEFKGKKPIFTFILLTLAIPPFLNIIPFFKMMVFFGWYQTWLPLIIPGMANAFGIFLMTQFLQNTVPSDLLDAGRIDGLNEFHLLFRVVFPLAKPGMAILGTVTFIGSWNNFLGALVMLPNPENTTIPVALSSLFVRNDGNYGGLLLGNAMAILPLLIIFLLFSRQIIDNLTAGSVKE